VSSEQANQRRLADAAATRARAISDVAHGEQAHNHQEPQIDVMRGVEL
jgi:hypothetical protein